MSKEGLNLCLLKGNEVKQGGLSQAEAKDPSRQAHLRKAKSHQKRIFIIELAQKMMSMELLHKISIIQHSRRQKHNQI
jgi:hypothetical protein